MRSAFKIALATAAATAAFGAMPAQAAQILSCGGASSCVTDTQNVLLNNATNVTVGTGETNTTPPAPVQFTTTESGLNLDASGQAVITAVDQVLNNLTFALMGNFTFQRAEFNLTNAIRSPLSVTITTNLGESTFNIANGAGSNRFGIIAGANEFLTSITFNSAIGFDSFRQLRIGGVAGPGGMTPAVPEPATWLMMLLGFGAIGWSMRARNAKRQGNVTRVGYKMTPALPQLV